MYAIFEAAGKQIRVTSGDEIKVDIPEGDINSEILFDKVLMISDGERIIWGKPYIEGAKVKAEVVSRGRYPKILVYGPPPKKARRRLRGHRQQYKLLRIKEIIGG
ncbi:MAG: 50S ribosomal protein L21 [Thermodesulfovibrionales bacterium]|nr:50S ribosomal protein L21 [Thermodesulfovibrionales bacterium]